MLRERLHAEIACADVRRPPKSLNLGGRFAVDRRRVARQPHASRQTACRRRAEEAEIIRVVMRRDCDVLPAFDLRLVHHRRRRAADGIDCNIS